MVLRRKTYLALDATWGSGPATRWVGSFLVCLIIINVVAVVLSTVPAIEAVYHTPLRFLEYFSVLVFGVEYSLRVWTCVEHPNPRFRHPVVGRLRYIVTPMAIIDLVAIVPFFVSTFLPYDLRILRIFRVIWLLKLTRYSRALALLGDVLVAEKRGLISAALIMLAMLTFASSLMYFVEHEQQPTAFGSIPQAMWWGVATLTTVGYGDVVPVTNLGRFLGACIALFGVGLFALPAAILVSGFSQQEKRQDFLTSWNLVASHPLFESLNAVQIADIAGLLEYRTTVPGEVIFNTGDQASKVFFLGSGEVTIQYEQTEREFGPGSFFGELALLHDDARKGKAICRSGCQLMVLARDDFFELMARNARLEEQIRRVAQAEADSIRR